MQPRDFAMLPKCANEISAAEEAELARVFSKNGVAGESGRALG